MVGDGEKGRGREPVGADAVVVAHQERRDTEPVPEHLPKICFRSKGREVPGEVENFDPVHAQGGQQGFFLFQRRQEPELPGIILKDGPRMRPEGDDKGLVPARARFGDEPLYHETVPAVDTVEKACGRNHLRSIGRTRSPDGAGEADAWQRCACTPGRHRSCPA